MKRFLAIAIAATMGLFVYSGTVQAATNVGGTGTMGITVVDIDSYTPGTSANGVTIGRHNLGDFSPHVTTRNASGQSDGTTQICVFCHTPHHSNTDARPLWNRNMPNSASYVGYGTTIAGTTIAKPGAGSASLACLSCHDGVTTFDNLVNAPGKGTDMTSTPWTFWEGAVTVSSLAGGTANMSFSSRLTIGTDLTNDHPVNVTYNAGTVASLRATNTTISQIDLSAGLDTSSVWFGWVTQNNWAVNGFVSSTATIGDLLRADNSTAGAATKVECSSCHDPHFSNGSYPEYTRDSNNVFTGLNHEDGVFLRRVGGNMGSGVCRTCHDK